MKSVNQECKEYYVKPLPLVQDLRRQDALPCNNQSAVLEHTLMMQSETSHVNTVTAKGLFGDCLTFTKVGVRGYVTYFRANTGISKLAP